VPAAEVVGAEVGASASAEVGGVVVGELVGSVVVGARVEGVVSAVVGGRVEGVVSALVGGVPAVVRGGRVGAVVVSLGASVPLGSVLLGSGRVPERSVVVRVAESPPPPAPQPLSPRTRPAASPARSKDLRIDDHLRIGRGRRGSLPGRRRRPLFGSRAPPASSEAGENGVAWARLASGNGPVVAATGGMLLVPGFGRVCTRPAME
jgi:hypothetical protein